MTSAIPRTSPGEQRLVQYLRLCDFIIIWGLGSGTVSLFLFRSVTVLGLGLGSLVIGSVMKLGGVVVAYLVMSSRTPGAEIAPWIRQWTRSTCIIGGLAAVWALVAAPNSAVRLIAVVAAVGSILLFRRVGPLAIGELGDYGPTFTTQRMFFLSYGPQIDVWLTAGWLVLAIVVRASLPSQFRPSAQKIATTDLKLRVLAVANAESRYTREHGSYSSDVAELRALGFPLIDSLVTVVADDRSYQAIARDPGGQMNCGLWSAARIGEVTALQINGAPPDHVVCWGPEHSTK